jgi:hypothetical protein
MTAAKAAGTSATHLVCGRRPYLDLILIRVLHPGLFALDRTCHLRERCTARDRCEPLSSDGVWTNMDQTRPACGGAALRVGALAGKADLRHLPPTSEPRPGNRFARSPAWWYPSVPLVPGWGIC